MSLNIIERNEKEERVYVGRGMIRQNYYSS